VSHPGAIEVEARDGRVRLSGWILADEKDALLRKVSRVRGVREVSDELEARRQAGDIPALQGAGQKVRAIRRNWSPTARLAAGTTGLGLGIAGTRGGGLFGLFAGAGGALLALRSFLNLPLRRLFGLGAGREAVTVQKTLRIQASVDEVFSFCNRFENFPHFMTNVKDVRPLGNNRHHWVVEGPLGTDVSWDSHVTEIRPNELLAWKSVPGSLIQHAGVMHFEGDAEGFARVHIRMSYNPPGGAIGHGLATLFGVDPKHQLDEDMVRMKTYLETGIPPRDAARRETEGEAAVG
jgi:uncharacterized membrane protein